ncbi:nuclear transport factor 2 family protein [Gordonia sp. LSe1-13]|uniref:Nuclear transport factor 2 family protein n=1 Tax=Gordonia sesuvii TaxID=3116777 RepID=A0ABU7M7D4_9ACTN|nr:nuclear transport factor 2 family protein [Gordonia sp. LSe1-13]
MLTIEEISARLEIEQVITDYCTAVDSARFDDLDSVFATDAVIDYTAMGGITGDVGAVKDWLSQVLPAFSAYCHLVGNHDIRVDGDTATTRTLCLNPMQVPDDSTFLLGLWYADEWRLTDAGWRITRRTLEKCFDAKI